LIHFYKRSDNLVKNSDENEDLSKMIFIFMFDAG